MNVFKYFILVALLCGCMTRNSYITQERYSQIQVGEPIASVVKEAGEPYSLTTNSRGEQEYLYIELFSTGTALVYENHYTFFVKDGKIVYKKMTKVKEPPYDLIYQDDPNHHYYP
ncbi:MAG: hypothetical protein EBZ47_00525 [Chlamydiae bacterium]|nr:hypothetical protein [Chlamydiota bacterium]